ncbi:translation initiation factor IF-2, partial [Candidatus Aerophobetes bacterium]
AAEAAALTEKQLAAETSAGSDNTDETPKQATPSEKEEPAPQETKEVESKNHSSTNKFKVKPSGDVASKKVERKHTPSAPPKSTTPSKPAYDPKKREVKKRTTAPAPQFDSRARQGLRIGEENVWKARRKHRRKTHNKSYIEIVRPSAIKIAVPISIKDLAQSMKRKASELLSKLFLQGVVITINDYLDDDTTVQLLGHDFGCEITIDKSEEEQLQITGATVEEEIKKSDPKELKKRAPVVAFMGHVDHGKTSLIDAIRKSNLAAGEAGAITQHIGAFVCKRDKGNLTILDTPGHEAFSLMRKRGASITDIIVLVIAGDEGIMPQTDEAIKHAKEAGVPIVVAINKCDKPGFNQDNVFRQLSDHDLLPEAWGGETITVNCSATTKEGIDALLEMLVLQSDVLELKANPSMRPRGAVIEAQMHKGFGSIATILVQNGTLKLGDALVIDHNWAKIKTMHDETGKLIQEAPPSTPVKITGISGVPSAGSDFIGVKNEKEAKSLASRRASGHKHKIAQRGKIQGLESLIASKQEEETKKVLNLIIKTDVFGSIEAIRNSLLNIKTKKVNLNFISVGVGEISESDVKLAHTSGAIILGFHTQVESHALGLITDLNVQIINKDIIYHLIDEVKVLMTNLLDKIREERYVGTFEVRQMFKVSRLGTIAGGVITDGIVKRQHLAKIFRKDELIFEGKIASLKRNKDDAKEVGKGLECGIMVGSFNTYELGDLIKTYEVLYLDQDL